MHAVLDSMIAVIDPEMPRQIERWDGNYNAWQENVQEIHDFIDERCAETLIGGIEDCYDVEAVTLTIIIDGLGQIEVNSVDIGPYDMPLDATYFAGVPMMLEAQEEYGELFLFWDVLDGDVALTNPTNPNLNFTLSGDATIIAYFAANADPQNVVFDVNPAGAGNIIVDGTSLINYPSTETLEYGAHTIEAIGLDEWHVFTGWTTSGTDVSPSALDADGGISITQAATVTANFELIPHVDLNVRVEPALKGSVRLEGGEVIVTNQWSGGLELDGLLNAEASPIEFWEFERWEIANVIPNPDSKSPSITLAVEDYEEIVAYFRPVDFAMYVPNAFSPNNDGLNDAFLPVGNAFKTDSYHLTVMNRWGEVVFESFNPEEPWIGEHQSGGHFVRDGLYVFMLEVQSVHELSPRRINGSVSVVR
jgi:gliding motility-associated-like protein